MKAWVGTSGYSYKAWTGSFYPISLTSKDWLSFYAAQLNSVEINNTFYRFPTKSVLQSWRKQVPPDFRFVIKAPKKITHFKRLKEAEKEVHDLCESIGVLGESLGALLFQLPPNLRKDIERLKTFLSWLPSDIPVAFEFRNTSWLDEEVYRALKEYNCALCVSDTDEEPNPEVASTADWGYLRLRRTSYSQAELEDWERRLRKHHWQKVYVYFKHEDGGKGPAFASELSRLLKK